MNIVQGIKILKEQIEKIDSLIVPPAFNPKYKMWDQTTQRILESIFDKGTAELFTSIRPNRVAHNEEDFFRIFAEMLGEKRQMLEEILNEQDRLANSDMSLAKGDQSTKEKTPESISTKVFIVHGRNEAKREMVARFLENLNLEPIILHEQPSEGRTIIEKFVDYSDVAFAVILLTGDDRGGLVSESFKNQKKTC